MNRNNNNEYLERLTRTGPKRLHILYKYILSKFNTYNMNAHTHARTHTDSHTRNEVATTRTKSAGRFECCHQASLRCSLLHSSIGQYMGSWQLRTCILFYSLVCNHSVVHSGYHGYPSSLIDPHGAL